MYRAMRGLPRRGYRIPANEYIRPAAAWSRRKESNSSARHMVHKFDA